MEAARVFSVSDFVQVSAGEPIRSVVSESADAVIVMWHVLPGQCIRPHVHPGGQDSWVVLAGAESAPSGPTVTASGHHRRPAPSRTMP